MKRLSQIFRPTLVVPKDAKLKPQELTSTSQRLLLECGLVRPAAPGCFALLPLATRSLHKLEVALRLALERVGAQRVSLPALAPATLWERSGRLEQMREELFTLEDRHSREYVLSPTHEEVITQLLAECAPLSHRQLPFILYQISNKYRDEKRPRHGLLRAREFLMTDAYSFHASEACARATYDRVTEAYARLLAALGVPYCRVEADNGAMGGSESHEWHYAAPAGEDALLTCESCARRRTRPDGDAPAACGGCGGIKFTEEQSIEVAHTFMLGTRYSRALGATYAARAGGAEPLVMACYGAGLTRLLAAGVEVLSGPERLRWPSGLAPYTAVVLGPKEGSAEWKSGGADAAEALAQSLEATRELRDDVLFDDRHQLTVGKRLLDADRMGYPLVAVVGREGLELHTHGAPPQTFNTQEQIVNAARRAVASLGGRESGNNAQELSTLTA